MNTPLSILIVDDELDICNFFRRLLNRRGHRVTTATSQHELLIVMSDETPFDVALVDLKLPDSDGLTLLQQIKSRQPRCEVIIMTGFSTIKTAVAAIQLGAYEYLEKPFDDIGQIEQLIEKAARCSQQPPTAGDEEWSTVARQCGFQVGQSPLMRQLVSLAYKIASKDINVLIQGKTGSGKEVLAYFIHAASGRAGQPFFPVNCAALTESMLESELFGHERGAFTGATGQRRGIFELAHQGTLFLDEIGDASPAIQVKLLRVLETGQFMRVGGEKPILADVRLISASNIDLETAVREKSFREDLFYRLNVVRFELPDLAQRREDIPQLAAYLLARHNPGMTLTPGVISLLQEHSWPGNIRELANVVRRAAALSSGSIVRPEALGHLLPTPKRSAPSRSPHPPATPSTPVKGRGLGLQEADLKHLNPEQLGQLLVQLEQLGRAILKRLPEHGTAEHPEPLLRKMEHDIIREALERHFWNITQTARSLGMGRNTLHRKIRHYGMRDEKPRRP